MKSIIFIGIAIVLVGIAIFNYPLWRNEEQIRRYILSITPVGSHMDEVIEVIRNNRRWQVQAAGRWMPLHAVSDEALPGRIESYVRLQSIRIVLGRTLLQSVDVWWEFDENVLVDVSTRKGLTK
ncbi:MAG: hypothetical protein FWG66_14030 [Spirochaetes bacterium]|nr:hypothetical protein [Spirochaetota bacterium]